MSQQQHDNINERSEQNSLVDELETTEVSEAFKTLEGSKLEPLMLSILEQREKLNVRFQMYREIIMETGDNCNFLQLNDSFGHGGGAPMPRKNFASGASRTAGTKFPLELRENCIKWSIHEQGWRKDFFANRRRKRKKFVVTSQLSLLIYKPPSPICSFHKNFLYVKKCVSSVNLNC